MQNEYKYPAIFALETCFAGFCICKERSFPFKLEWEYSSRSGSRKSKAFERIDLII